MNTYQAPPHGAHSGASALAILAAFGAGFALMFFLDPANGRRRRGMVQEKSQHYTREALHQRDVLARRVLGQLRGVIAGIRHQVEPDELVEDAVLLERVRAAMGHVVPDPQGVDIRVRSGMVVLKGPASADQIGELVACAGRVRGVRGVENRLSPNG